MLHLAQEDIDYLKPSQEANFIQHPAPYIKSGSENSSRRAIFYGVDLEPYEVEQIEHFKHEISHSGTSINSSWGDRELLKYLYSTNFNTHKAVANLKESLRYRTEIQLLPVTHRTLEVLHSGIIYPFGRDNQSRPILIINLEKLDATTADKNELSIITNFYLDSLKQYSFIQGKVENLILIIDAADKEFNGFPFDKFDTFLKRIMVSHPTVVEKVYILNASSSFRSQYNALKDSLENNSFDNVQFLSSNETSKLQENIPKAQLEAKYGGVAPNVSNFWPVSAIGSYRRTHIYETAPVQPHERYTSSGVYGNMSHFDFDTTEHKKIYERTTMTLPVSEYTYRHSVEHEHKVKSSPPVHVHEDLPPAPTDIKYDFNDEALLDLVAGEHEFIKKNIGDYQDSAMPITTQGNLYPISTSTTYQVDKKTPVYQHNGFSSHHVEEWPMKKYLKSVEDKEEEETTKVEFCGLCVSHRRTAKP